tara:strand:- start:2893 stop:3924 length:1032 start_codon:yes stop_codon:yes gene_type:complete
MNSQKYIFYIIFISSYLLGKTPIEYTIGITGGYDNNVLRFSTYEFGEAALDNSLMGGASTFDSFVYKLRLSGKKSVWHSRRKDFSINGFYSWSDYQNNTERKYWSGGLDAIYKWGSYKNIKYSVRHLNSFYLRHYINRDISNDLLAPCYFTDRNQSITITQKILRESWINLSTGYLQRYYDKPFTEFDLDIHYIKGRVNYKIKRIATISFQINRGHARSTSHLSTERPSSFNRSYNNMEWYMPVKIHRNIPIVDEIGFSIREEYRKYGAEDPDDPLHAGRDHIDSKYDVWVKKEIFEAVSVLFTGRYRIRTTDSAYEWVKDLKSFNQIQFWCKIEWDMVYDRY